MKKKLFILLFLFSLAGPALLYPVLKPYVDTANYENRELAAFPDLSPGNFEHIPAEFEAYYNDHVPFKNYFVKLNNKIETEVFGKASVFNVTLGKDGWMFYTVSVKGEDALADYQHTNLYTVGQRSRLGESFQRIQKGMEEKGIRFFLFEVPNKETVYGQYMPDKVRVYGEESRLEALLPVLEEEYGVKVYDMTDSLRRSAGQYQVYYKYDTHWNYIGAFVGSQEIAKALGCESVSLEDVTVGDDGTRVSGDLARMLGMTGEYSDDPDYRISGYLPQVTPELVLSEENEGYEVFESDSSNHRTLLLIGDSFIHNMKPYLSRLYERVIFLTHRSYTPEVFEQYRIDDCVYMTVERNQKYFENAETILEGTYREAESR